jgi:hypothetical protein
VRRSPPDLSLAPGLSDVQDRCTADDGGNRTRWPVRRQALLKRDATIDRIVAAGSANDGTGSPKCRVRQPRRRNSRIWCLPSSSGCQLPGPGRFASTCVASHQHGHVRRDQGAPSPGAGPESLPASTQAVRARRCRCTRAGCYFPAVRPGPGQSMCSTALPPMRRPSRASIASAGWRQEHSSSTWASRRSSAARAHRRARSLDPLACAVSSLGRSSV